MSKFTNRLKALEQATGANVPYSDDPTYLAKKFVAASIANPIESKAALEALGNYRVRKPAIPLSERLKAGSKR
jgi:hypothetical protein